MGDVFLAAWRRIADAPPAADALPWLYRISYLTIGNHWRGLKRRRALETKLNSLGVTAPTPVADQVATRVEVRTVLDLLGNLKPADAEVLRLVAWEQLSNQEIADVLGVSPATAKQRVSRARKRLAQTYEKKNQAINPPLLGKEVSGEL